MIFTVGKTLRFKSREAMERAFATGDFSEAVAEDNEFSRLSDDVVMVTAVDRENGVVTTDVKARR